jgi:hypothetical protein
MRLYRFRRARVDYGLEYRELLGQQENAGVRYADAKDVFWWNVAHSGVVPADAYA